MPCECPPLTPHSHGRLLSAPSALRSAWPVHRAHGTPPKSPKAPQSPLHSAAEPPSQLEGCVNTHAHTLPSPLVPPPLAPSPGRSPHQRPRHCSGLRAHLPRRSHPFLQLAPAGPAADHSFHAVQDGVQPWMARPGAQPRLSHPPPPRTPTACMPPSLSSPWCAPVLLTRTPPTLAPPPPHPPSPIPSCTSRRPSRSQAEAPPIALFGTFKEVIATGGAAHADIAFYFVHWLTDLAGAEPSPLAGSEKFVLKFPHAVCACLRCAPSPPSPSPPLPSACLPAPAHAPAVNVVNRMCM